MSADFKKYINSSELLKADSLLYLLRCLFGVVLSYWLYYSFPQYPFHWAVVSVVVAISPDNSPQLAIDRMKANILGCIIGLSLFFIHPPNIWMMCIGVTLVISIGLIFQMAGSIRSALAAIVVLMVSNEQPHDWRLAVMRVVAVIAGCLIALIVTLGFNTIFRTFQKKQPENDAGNQDI